MTLDLVQLQKDLEHHFTGLVEPGGNKLGSWVALKVEGLHLEVFDDGRIQLYSRTNGVKPLSPNGIPLAMEITRAHVLPSKIKKALPVDALRLDPVLVSKTLDDFQQEVGEWGDVTFPSSNIESVISHFREEAGEFTEEPSGEEAADCLMLLIHYAHKSGISLYQEAERKFAINRKRVWKTTPEPGGHIKHDSGEDTRHE